MNPTVTTPAPTPPTAPADAPATPPGRSRRSWRPWLWVLGTAVPAVCAVATILFVPGVEHGSDLQGDLTDKAGVPVTCPGDITARAGATMVCSAVDTDGTTHHLLVTVTAAHGFYPINRTIEYSATVQD